MRVFSHTCSNTEIVCALGAADCLVGIDDDSDFPAEVVAALPKLGRDLDLRVPEMLALKPDLVLTSLTVPGHERIVAELAALGLKTLVCDPLSLEDIYGDIARIAVALGIPERGAQLIEDMRAAMPRVETAHRPRVLIEWWPKPVIAPTRLAWATDLIELAGGCNPWAAIDAKSSPLSDEQILATPPDLIAMSWCGVKAANYRAEVVSRRPGWAQVPAVRAQRIVGISEEYLGRPGPRVVEGYRRLRAAIAACA
ncbi:MAG: cobalamin-binding protein [Nevskia sp.]